MGEPLPEEKRLRRLHSRRAGVLTLWTYGPDGSKAVSDRCSDTAASALGSLQFYDLTVREVDAPPRSTKLDAARAGELAVAPGPRWVEVKLRTEPAALTPQVVSEFLAAIGPMGERYGWRTKNMVTKGQGGRSPDNREELSRVERIARSSSIRVVEEPTGFNYVLRSSRAPSWLGRLGQQLLGSNRGVVAREIIIGDPLRIETPEYGLASPLRPIETFGRAHEEIRLSSSPGKAGRYIPPTGHQRTSGQIEFPMKRCVIVYLPGHNVCVYDPAGKAVTFTEDGKIITVDNLKTRTRTVSGDFIPDKKKSTFALDEGSARRFVKAVDDALRGGSGQDSPSGGSRRSYGPRSIARLIKQEKISPEELKGQLPTDLNLLAAMQLAGRWGGSNEPLAPFTPRGRGRSGERGRGKRGRGQSVNGGREQ